MKIVGIDKFLVAWSQPVGLIQTVGREGECVHQCSFEEGGSTLLI